MGEMGERGKVGIWGGRDREGEKKGRKRERKKERERARLEMKCKMCQSTLLLVLSLASLPLGHLRPAHPAPTWT